MHSMHVVIINAKQKNKMRFHLIAKMYSRWITIIRMNLDLIGS